jgi:ribonuclease J
MILGISVDKTSKKIIAGPDIQMRGLIFLKDADDFLKNLVRLFQNLVEEALERGQIDDEDTRVKIRDKVNIFVRKSTGKDPMVLPVIISI